MWIGMACLLTSITLVLFWADLKPSSWEPSTSLPGEAQRASSPSGTGATASATDDPSTATIPPTIPPNEPPTGGPNEPRTGLPTGPATGLPTEPASGLPTGAATGHGGSPVRLESARGLSVPAAATFTRAYFVEAINYAKVTGDVTAIRAWSDVSCMLCRQNITGFAASNQANGLLTGDHRWRDAQVGQVQLMDPATASVDLSVSVGRHWYRSKPGAQTMTLAAQTVDLHVTLAAAGGDWVMFDWERLP